MSKTKEVTISIEEYKEFLEAKQKCKQYRNYFYENGRNKMIDNGLMAIEGKPIHKIIEDIRKEEKESEVR